MSEENKKNLQSRLWDIANTLRGKMGADEFRDYILGFIFYKYLSERMHQFADEILKHDGIKFDAIDETTVDGQEMLAAIEEESVGWPGYFLKPAELFHKLAEKSARKSDNFILEDLTAILKHIESSTMGHDSEEDFEGLFEDLDLGSSKLGKTENQKNELIAKVLVHLDAIDFRLDDTEADVLGDAYEYLIGQFASGAGKKAGEFYTPQQVSTILAKIVTTGKTSLKNVYDPSCGFGSLLLRVASQGFEKVGNQNQLRPEDIERIVETYRKREPLEKFSHVADLSEVAENDYNLNIPRYVDTFEEEEPVDLAEVSEKLAVLEKAMGETDDVIAGFCQELGI
ncbi:N-6 DNA methylase [Pontiellaceae bacterium B1224]|nr:N-6 DNA methylase [Pontiellaceae bacterium B1224]